MSERQKRRKLEIEMEQGRFPPAAIRHSSAVIFRRLVARCDDPLGLELWTDEHFQYRRALAHDLAHAKVRHTTVSSNATRLFKHILFPVNHMDLLLRHHNKAFTRETISFAKKHSTMIQRYALVMVWKNYFRPQFSKRHRKNPVTNVVTPAMAVGIEKSQVKFGEFFWRTRLPTQCDLPSEWQKFYRGEHTYPRSLDN